MERSTRTWLSRRTFLTSALAAGAAAGTLSLLAADEQQPAAPAPREPYRGESERQTSSVGTMPRRGEPIRITRLETILVGIEHAWTIPLLLEEGEPTDA